MNYKSVAGWAVAVIVIVVAFVNVMGQREIKRQESKASYAKERAEAKARFDRGPFVANESRISPTEIAKTVIYPGKDDDYYSEMYDSTCLVYLNEATGRQSMTCTGMLFDRVTNTDSYGP